jgi:hypothetical protein
MTFAHHSDSADSPPPPQVATAAAARPLTTIPRLFSTPPFHQLILHPPPPPQVATAAAARPPVRTALAPTTVVPTTATGE